MQCVESLLVTQGHIVIRLSMYDAYRALGGCGILVSRTIPQVFELGCRICFDGVSLLV